MENTADRAPIGAHARTLVRRAWKAALGTIDRTTGHPHTSLVTVATEPDGTPLLLLSGLALHTMNLKQDSRASLLIEGTGAGSNVLAGERVTVIGSAAATADPIARARFLARHPSAETFANFADFAFHRLQIARAHFVGGFGRIVELEAHELLIPTGDAEALIAAEAQLVSQLNEVHSDALQLLAAQVGNAAPGRWRLVGIDPDGLDLALADHAVRLPFGHRVRTAGEARRAIMALATAVPASAASTRLQT